MENCFAILHWFLPTAMQISHIYIYTHIHVCVYICIYHFPLEPPSIPPSHPSRSSQSASLRSLCYLATSLYFTHDNVYMSMLLSQFVPPSPCPTVSTSPFYTRFISTIFSSFCIYVLVFLFLAYFTLFKRH